GFSAAQADSLRRAMSRKRSEEEIERHHQAFVAGAVKKKKVPKETAERVWSQIQGFSGFGFPKAHSAAFGLLAYQSAWLRIHRAQEFLCALLNEQPMGFYPPDALVHEAQRRGVRLAGPDANRSQVLCHVERERGDLTLRIGVGYVKGVREEEMKRLTAERERSGDYASIADLASRSGVRRDGLERLAWAGALDAFIERSSSGRREALWEAGGVAVGEGLQMALPLEPPRASTLEPLGDWERMIADYRSIGMTLDEHPMGMMRGDLGAEVCRASDLEKAESGEIVEAAGMVVARQRPQTANGVVFMLLEDETGTVNLVLPPAVYERCRAAARAAPLAHARGKLERQEGTTNVLVSELVELLPQLPKPKPRPQPAGGRRRAAAPPSPKPSRRRIRERAIAELRAVAPAGHSWGRRR
ncbi:MAG: DNA polymerase III subunit alpha, partial [Solirubrobacterales bacterium]